jgi:hypothetical protein
VEDGSVGDGMEEDMVGGSSRSILLSMLLKESNQSTQEIQSFHFVLNINESSIYLTEM